MKRRVLSTILAIAMGCSMLVGCGSGGTEKADTAGASDTTGAADNAAEASDLISVEKDTLLKLGTGGSSGTIYFLGAAMQEGVSKNFSNLQIASEATNGSNENVRRVNSGELQMALTSPNAVKVELEAGNIDAANVCYLGSNYPNPWYLVGNTDLPTELADALVPGTAIGYGEPGSSLQDQMSAVLEVVGLTVDDMNAEMISMAEEVTALIDDRIDVGVFGGPIPFATVEQIAAQVKGGVHILNWTDEQVEKLTTIDEFATGITIPANTYEGQDYEVQTVGWHIAAIIRADVDEDTVYELTKYLYTHSEELAAIYPQGAGFVPENALINLEQYEEIGIQVHPGAARYYKEIGIME